MKTTTRLQTKVLQSLLLCFFLVVSCARAETNFTLGFWANYRYLPDDSASRETWGQIRDEAMILYASGRAPEGDRSWLYESELRIGPGSFTDPNNNSTGNNFAFKTAWVGWELTEYHTLRVGQTRVPFGWNTVNFWPGDILLGGFGDHTDVGIKLSRRTARWDYDAAFFLADDWGGRSTDTVDDNAHWGSSTTFRKVRTWVGNLSYHLSDAHSIGLAAQAGGLQDLTDLGSDEVDGNHEAAIVYYQGTFDNFYVKASFITTERELPPLYRQEAQLPEKIRNQRLATEIGYDLGPWSFYWDWTAAFPNTDDSQPSKVTAHVPGLKYNYGPGWIYLEFLSQSGDLDRDGRVAEGDFEAVYVTIDFYL
ncbi:porin [Marinimicrobium sp. ABcell2]|uniref:porin n=1 Tax=Marinimicrobium sp. ABcell2 TaxID=3069751 RepID=UPI0027B32AF2|nr:hypothetical protein [Marinimicrobium sp. ABcell2]MDQ2075987.1 hypothetical protein [Marinimicrobium sp. ABcell2]